ncbi:hypothetical protein [Fodinibius saliphilus]|nr:hypothetical protein [Fodinibius saliphilus]
MTKIAYCFPIPDENVEDWFAFAEKGKAKNVKYFPKCTPVLE